MKINLHLPYNPISLLRDAYQYFDLYPSQILIYSFIYYIFKYFLCNISVLILCILSYNLFLFLSTSELSMSVLYIIFIF